MTARDDTSGASPSAEWHAQLDLHYRMHDAQCVVQHQHSGPLRVLKSLYPEGPGVCHSVLVHPPSGLVGGDTLNINVQVDEHAHALLTTPGATRFYRCTPPLQAVQRVRLHVGAHARLEWLPLEAIAYSHCNALNQVQLDLAPSAQAMLWDITALGLPAAGEHFEQGCFAQHLQIPGVWLEKGVLDGSDLRLRHSPAGLNGQSCLATLVMASGSAWPDALRDTLLTQARAIAAQHTQGVELGVTSPHPQVLVVRGLSLMVEPAFNALRAIWQCWRQTAWALGDTPPRIWSM